MGKNPQKPTPKTVGSILNPALITRFYIDFWAKIHKNLLGGGCTKRVKTQKNATSVRWLTMIKRINILSLDLEV